MSSLRRAGMMVMGLAVFGVLAWFQADTTVLGQDKEKQEKPAPPPVVIGVKQVIIQKGGAVVPAVPAKDDQNKDAEFTDSLTLPTDRKARRVIEAAEDFIKEEEWGQAARHLQSLLSIKEDVFLDVKRKGADQKTVIQWTSVRSEANRLIGTMPAKGLEFYELQYGAEAKSKLSEAKSKGDPHLLADVAQRYLHTEAGAEATNLLGTYHLDRGRFVMAALCYERLLSHEKGEQLTPMTLFKACLAFRKVGDKNNGELAWKRLAKAARDGIQISGQTVSLDQLQGELDKTTRDDLTVHPSDWLLFKGNATRTAQGDGGAPFLEVKWTQPTIRQDETKKLIDQALQAQDNRQLPTIPAFFPIAATVRGDKGNLPLLVYRSYFGIHAVDLRTGKLKWEARSNWSLDEMLRSSDKKAQLMNQNNGAQWLPAYVSQGGQHFLFENANLGTLSADGNRVYAVNDLALPPHPMMLQQLQWGGRLFFGALEDAVYHSRLEAYDLESGKLKWELGGRGPEKGELAECYFLGPPLPLGGKLYVLVEKNSELRLVCLDTPRGDENAPPTISWSQTLASARDRLLLDVSRRIQAVNMSYGEGILVCPTNAGAVLGVDLLSHSLVWAHSYRDAQPKNDPKLGGLRPGMAVQMVGGMPFNGQLNQMGSDWKASAPIIQDGKVVFTAPDGPTIQCLNLRDGTLLWKASRNDDLYLGGVYNGKVVLVGRNSCRALNLNDGKQIWSLQTGMPSGQGVASKNVYYLPLKSGPGSSKEPEVCAIDIEKGDFQAHTKSRKKADGKMEVPGNLLFYEGDVVSQTVTHVTAYPQLQIKLAQIDERLKLDPKDPIGLTERGELRLDKGDLAGAVDDLHTALNSQPSENASPEERQKFADILPKTRAKLFDTLTELFQRDFIASEKYLDEYKKMCAVAIPKDATPEETKQLQEEQQHRQANFLCLLAKGREKQGRLEDAFQAYKEFGELNGNKELVNVIDEPTVKTRPDVWAQGRIAAMIAKATPEQRQPLEGKIAEQWQAIKGKGDTKALRDFVAVFGSHFTDGKQARLQLAEQLMIENKDNSFLEAEMQLLQLRSQEDRELAGRAVEALARLCIRKGLLENAAYWYRILGRDFASVTIRDGKTGADFLNDLATDKRFLPYLDDQRQVFRGSLKAKEMSTAAVGFQQNFFFEPQGEVLPFFQRHRLALNMQQFNFKMLDRASNNEVWPAPIQVTRSQVNLYNNNNLTNFRLSYQLQGHLIVLSLGHMVYAIDPIDHRLLWEKNLLGASLLNQMQCMPDGNGGWQVIYPDGRGEKIGQTGPAEASHVCLHTRDGLVALDPLTGTTLWTRHDVSLRTQIFGDDKMVYLVDVRPDGSASGGRALRARDGVTVDVPEFGALYQRRLRILGRNLLVTDSDPQGGMALRLYDVQTGKDLWKKGFTANAVVLKSEDPHLAGVVEPNNGGKITVVDLRTYQEVFGSGWHAPHPRVDPKDLDKVQEISLLTDAHLVYLACNKPPDQQANPWGGPWANVMNGMRWIAVNGPIYAFDRGTGKLRWKNEVLNQMAILEQFEEMPMLVFTARYNRPLNQGGNRIAAINVSAVKSIEKRTGKLLFDKEFQNDNNNYHALIANFRLGTFDLVSYNRKIQHYVDGDDARTKNEGTRQESAIPAPQPANQVFVPVQIRAVPAKK